MSTPQYIRRCTLLVSDALGSGLDLSELRVQFAITKSDSQTPNSSSITVFNLSDSTARRVQDEFARVVLQAGYDANFGVIFEGNIKQVKIGKSGGVDSFFNIAGGDGDEAYNFAIVNTTLSAGATQADQIAVAAAAMASSGVERGFIDDTGSAKLPRGKVMYGMARDVLRQSTRTSGTTWSIQGGQLQVIKRSGVLPSQAVLLNRRTGLIGLPEQTDKGMQVRCLLNPLMAVGGQVKIDDDVEADGVYRILTVKHLGDTYGNDWYTDLTCLSIDESAPEGEQVSAE